MIDITSIVAAALTLIFAVIGTVLIPYIRTKLSADKQADLAYWVGVAVKAAEQLFAQDSSSGKSKYAWVTAFLDQQGISANTEAIKALIEAEVLKLNQQKKVASYEYTK